MLFITKEYLSKENLLVLCTNIKTAKFAETKDDRVTQEIYRKMRDKFIIDELQCNLYFDQRVKLQQIDASIAKVASEKNREVYEDFKGNYISIYKKRVKNGSYFTFDVNLAERRFAEEFYRNMEAFELLPNEILSKVADIRMLALGYASKEVKKLMHPYCINLRRICKRFRTISFCKTDALKDLLSQKIKLDCLEGNTFQKMKKRGRDYVLVLNDENLYLKNATILEGAHHRIFRRNYNVPHSAFSIVTAVELHFAEEEGFFELHFLITNTDTYNRRESWYLTFVCKDIVR